MRTRPRALFFAFDSTLLDNSGFRETIRYTCEAICAAHPPLDAARLLAANDEVWTAYWPSVERQWELGGITGEAVSLEGWRRTLRACGCDNQDAERIAQKAREIHRGHRRANTRLFPDAVDTLEALSRAGIPLALITNAASDTQRDTLRRHGIERHFGAIVVSGEHGVAKPDPAIFHIALDQLGLSFGDPDEIKGVWHIGDNPYTDVAGAAAAGLTAVWLNRRRRPLEDDAPRPDHEIHSLAELAALLSVPLRT